MIHQTIWSKGEQSEDIKLLISTKYKTILQQNPILFLTATMLSQVIMIKSYIG